MPRALRELRRDVSTLELLDDHLSRFAELHLEELWGELIRGGGARGPFRMKRRGRRGEEDEPRNRVAELADVPRPRVGREHLGSIGRQVRPRTRRRLMSEEVLD